MEKERSLERNYFWLGRQRSVIKMRPYKMNIHQIYYFPICSFVDGALKQNEK